MSRKMMSREITKTTVKIGHIVQNEEGNPELVQLDPIVMLGNVSMERAQKEMNKIHDVPVTVFGVETDTKIYQMAVEDFVKHGTIKED